MSWRSKVTEAAKVLLAMVLCCAAIAAVLGVVRIKWQTADAHEDRCKKYRREFFDGCLAVEPRYRCEVQWAQLDGKVFDSAPNQIWSGQIDCSGVK